MKRATFLYEGRLEENNDLFDSSNGSPLTISFGRGQVMPLIEDALQTMEIGETREIFIPAKDGYGERKQKAIQRVLVKDVPNGDKLPVNEYIAWKNPVTEHPIPVKVLSVRNGIAVFDMNHPLAGKNLIYKIKLLERN